MGTLLDLFFKIVILIILLIYNNGCDGKNYSFKFCDSIQDCSDSNQICLNKECKCGPNYKFNSLLRICVNFKCVNDLDCQEFDNNQVCNNSCICNRKYIRNVSTNLCSDELIGETGLGTKFDDKNVFKGNEKKSFQPIFNPKSSLELYNCLKKRCNNDSDCRNCDLMGQYCVDNKCSFNCKSVSEGDSCDYKSDCNPMCDFYSYSSKKYCVDKKCSIFETNIFESSGKKRFQLGIFWWINVYCPYWVNNGYCFPYLQEKFQKRSLS